MTWQWPFVLIALAVFFAIAAAKAGRYLLTQRPCPHCRTRVSSRARVCPACSRDIVTA